MENRVSLRRLIRTQLRGAKFLVVSNREPYQRVHQNGHVEWMRSAGGVSVALDPVMQASSRGGLGGPRQRRCGPRRSRRRRYYLLDPAAEVRRRMDRMRQRVCENNVYKWAGDVIRKLLRLT